MNQINAIGLRRAVACLLGLAACGAAPSSSAAVSCTIATLSSAAFGIYNPYSALALDGAATASISCSGTLSGEVAKLSITASAGLAGSFFPRKMQGPGLNLLNYNLYIDAARTQIFGTGAAGTFADTGSARTPVTFTHTIYARVPAGQDVAVGAYSDVLIYTVNF